MQYIKKIHTIDRNQYDITSNLGIVLTSEIEKCYQLFLAGKGTREFIFLRIDFKDGTIKFYLNELVSGKLEEIKDDEEYEEVNDFIQNEMAKINKGYSAEI